MMEEEQATFILTINDKIVKVSYDPNMEMLGWAHVLSPESDTTKFSMEWWVKYKNKLDYVKLGYKNVDAAEFIASITPERRTCLQRWCATKYTWPREIPEFDYEMCDEEEE
jgi:hypothetical protein